MCEALVWAAYILPRPLTQWPRVRCITTATATSSWPQWRTPRLANSIWSYLPSSHSAESVSVSKDHYHILSMSSFMAPVYSSARASAQPLIDTLIPPLPPYLPAACRMNAISLRRSVSTGLSVMARQLMVSSQLMYWGVRPVKLAVQRKTSMLWGFQTYPLTPSPLYFFF